MATLLETASLVMVPSGYEDGTLGSLVPTDASGDFTFTRGSNLSATRVNEQGLIEKGYENLLLQSNTFSDTSVWTNLRVNSTSNELGYDGSNDAWKIECIAAGKSRLDQAISISGVNTISFYAKAGTANYAIALVDSGIDPRAWFNLSTGAVESSISNIDASIEDVGNGWYKCSMAFDITSSIIYLQVGNTNSNLNAAIGDNIYIQDAQLNQGLAAYPYIETTAAPKKGGILADLPRLDYSNGRASLLLEPQRTNLIGYSEYPEGNQFFDNLIPEYSATTSPEGVINATKITATGAGVHKYGNFPVVSSGVGVVGSIFVKADTTEYVQLHFGGGPASGSPYANFFIGDNPNVERERDLTASIEDYGNGWLRLIIKQTTDSSGGITFAVMPIPNGATIRDGSYTANGESIFTYGLQFEQDATYPTSYIPTYGTSQTRLAEDLELPTLSSVFDSTGSFTLFFEIERLSSSVQQQILYIRGLGYFRLDATADNRLKFVIYGGGASVTEANSGINTFVAGTSSKIVYKQNGTIGQCFINGQEISSGVPTILTGFFTFYQRNENHIKHQEVYFPTALSDEACIELTTL